MGGISSLMNKELDSEPVYADNDKYIKAKIKSYGDKINDHTSMIILSMMI